MRTKSGTMACMEQTEKQSHKAMERFLAALHFAVLVVEVLVAMALTALAAGALFSLGAEMWLAASTMHPLTRIEFTSIMGSVLQVFILVELFRIALAYMKHENVVPTVLEAALVAVARQFVVFEGAGPDYLIRTLGLSALLLAVAISWWLLAKSNACEMRTE
jgi:uncharacterized membrane protein (DUF373 family)